MTKDGLKVGFIGLGTMGTPMALNLLKAGHALFVSSRSKVPGSRLGPHLTPIGLPMPRIYSTCADPSNRVRSPIHSICADVSYQPPVSES